MRILIVDDRGISVPRFEEEHLFVSRHSPDLKVARYIDRVSHNLEDENGTEYFVYSFSCGVDPTNLEPACQ